MLYDEYDPYLEDGVWGGIENLLKAFINKGFDANNICAFCLFLPSIFVNFARLLLSIESSLNKVAVN
jgi:hypothetical protein